MGDKKVSCKMAEITECLCSYGDNPGQESLWTRGRTIPGAGQGDGILSRVGAENTSPTDREGGQRAWAQLKAVGDICKVSSNCFCFEIK